jgi:hypothetical protein
MAYVEFLRVRKAFYIFGGVIVALVGILLISLYASHPGDGHNSFRLEIGRAIILEKGNDGKLHEVVLSGMPGINIPLGALFAIAGYCAAIFATVISTSLNKERDALDFPFTRPEPRTRIALSYFAVDLAGVFVAFLFSLVVIGLMPLALAGLLGRITADGNDWLIGALGLGISIMWFGIIQAITAPYRGGGGWIAGVSWGFFGILLLLPGATLFGPVVHTIVMVLNLANPLAYYSSITGSEHEVKVEALINLGLGARSAITWAIGIATCAVAVFSWKRLEV